MSSDEDACDICNGDKSSKKNPIIFCDGEDCNLPVHKMCYKVDEVPEDDWFCQRCDNKIKNKPVKIVCCPTETGAAKHTVTFGDFMHVVCATWNKEIMSDLEPYSFNKRLLNQKTCIFCKKSRGLCVECEEKDCSNAFHVTCGINNGLITPAIDKPLQYKTKCDQHQPTSPIKKQSNIRRRLVPGSLQVSSSSDEASESDESDEEDVVMEGPPRSEPENSKRSAAKSSSDEDDDDMGTSKKPKFAGGPYKFMAGAKKQKMADRSGVDSQRSPKVNSHIKTPLILPPKPTFKPSSSSSSTSGSGPSSPVDKRPAEKRPERPVILTRNDGQISVKPSLGRPEKNASRPRWAIQTSSQPTTPSISSQSFFDTDTVQRRSTGDEIEKLKEELETMTRSFHYMTDQFNRSRDEKKRMIGFKKAVTDVLGGLNVLSPAPTFDTIEQYIVELQALIQIGGPVTDEEKEKIEEFCKIIKPE
ncbi:unnamed protein product [Rhizopus stolonifer]